MIFLTGPHGAGKTEISKLLTSYGFEPIDLGPTIRRLHAESGTELGMRDWCLKGEQLYGPHFTDKVLATEMNRLLGSTGESKSAFSDLLVVGSRSVSGINYLKSEVQHTSGYQDVIIFLDASEEILRRNYNQREGKEYSPEQFAEILEHDRKMGIDSIRSISDYVIRNEGTLQMLEAAIQSLIFGTLKYRRM